MMDGAARQSNNADLVNTAGTLMGAHVDSIGGTTLGNASTAVFGGCGAEGCGERDWDITHGYKAVVAANAMDHVFEVVNAKRYKDNASYWAPEKEGLGIVTWKFDFQKKLKTVCLKMGYKLFNLGSSRGSFSVWGSADAVTWIQLGDYPTPSATSKASGYYSILPSVLLEGETIYIQARMKAENPSSPNSSPVWLCWDTEVYPGGSSGTSYVFFLKAEYVD
jgi:hypothetical protein